MSSAAQDPTWAWAAYKPNSEHPWDLKAAGHLLRRAAFGGTWPELERALGDGPQKTVQRLLHTETADAALERTYDGYEASAAGSDSTEGLQAWWLRRMLVSPNPLGEKMTLFWQGQFAASNARVRSSMLMAKHVQVLRKHAMGSYRALFEAMLGDAAVLKSLGAEANRKSRPESQLARQVLEWVGLDGACSPQDIDGIARAMTGWFVRRDELEFVAREHDEGSKSIFGAVGNFRRDDLASLLLKRPEASRRVVRKLYRWFISEVEEPADGLMEPLARSFAADYDIGKLVETMLRSNLFFSPAAYRKRIKSPVEFAMGILRPLGGLVPTTQLGQDVRALGQDLYEPPTTRGWEGGAYWLNQATLVRRGNLAWSLLDGSGSYGGSLDPAAVAAQQGAKDLKSAKDFLLRLFLQGDLRAEARERLMSEEPGGRELGEKVRRFAHKVMLQPEFQLG